MRILLVQHSLKSLEAYPLGLGYVAAVLREAGHSIEFLDLALEDGDPAKKLLQVAKESRAKAIGLTAVTPQYNECLSLVKKIRPNLQGIPIIMGGPHPSILPEEVLRDGAADIVVIAEGELLAPILFRALEEGDDLNSVPGIAFLDQEGTFIRTSPGGTVDDLDTIPFPPWDIFHPERYRGRIRGSKRVNLLTSRGCPHRCSFCYRGPSSVAHYRQRSINNVMEEIHQLYKNYGIGGFGFRDDIFTHDMDRARELCDTIRAERLRINWMCETRVDRVDFDLLRRMKRAGCVTVEFGVESGNDDIRRKLRKITTKDQIRQAFRYCHELKIPSMAFFMIGTPWETPQTVEETIAFAKELRATMTIFFLATPFPGTELRKEFLKAGWNIPKNYDAYKHFIEGSGFSMLKDEVQSKDLRSFYSVECRRATKEITLSQVRDVLHYPELLHAYLLRHSFGEFAIKAVQRLKGIF